MFGLAARLINGAFAPLIDQALASSARLLWKLALFVVSGLSMIVVLIALTIAFDLWIASMKGPVVGALAVAGLYALIAAVTLFLALRSGAVKDATRDREADKNSADQRDMDTSIDDFAAPLLGILDRLGLRKEQLAVLAGTSVAKRMGPIPLVGLAIVAGFLIGRLWRGLFPTDLLAGLFTSDVLSGLFGTKDQSDETARDAKPDGDESRDAA